MTAHASLSATGLLGRMGSGQVEASAALSGSGTVEAGTSSFFATGTSGPSTATANMGTFVSGIVFKAASTAQLNGYYWWVCPSGGETSAQRFALWDITTSNILISAANITSGTLSSGWNAVTLGSPVSLTTGHSYIACTQYSGNFPLTENQFGSGDPFSAGITSGPGFAYSDQSGSEPAPNSLPQGVFSTVIDIASNPPDTAFDSSNFWIDVILAT